MSLTWDSIQEGDTLPELTKKPGVTQLVKYAAGGGDFNPLHHDYNLSMPRPWALFWCMASLSMPVLANWFPTGLITRAASNRFHASTAAWIFRIKNSFARGPWNVNGRRQATSWWNWLYGPKMKRANRPPRVRLWWPLTHSKTCDSAGRCYFSLIVSALNKRWRDRSPYNSGSILRSLNRHFPSILSKRS